MLIMGVDDLEGKNYGTIRNKYGVSVISKGFYWWSLIINPLSPIKHYAWVGTPLANQTARIHKLTSQICLEIPKNSHHQTFINLDQTIHINGLLNQYTANRCKYEESSTWEFYRRT